MRDESVPGGQEIPIPRLLEEFASACDIQAEVATPGGWGRLSLVLDGAGEEILRKIRNAVYELPDPTSREEEILRRMEAVGVPVGDIFLAGGATEEVEAKHISIGDAAEYVGAALLIRADGLAAPRVWGKNLWKLKRSSSEVGIDVLAYRPPETVSRQELEQGESLFLVSAKASSAKNLRRPVTEIRDEFNNLTPEAFAQEIKMFREVLRRSGDEFAERMILFIHPFYTDRVDAEALSLRAVALVDESRLAEMVDAFEVLDGVESTTGRFAWAAGTQAILTELPERLAP
jgi:hypothetical protein